MSTFLLSGCKDERIEPEPPAMPDKAVRTVLVYMVADNNLSTYANADIAEMLYGKGDIGDNDHLILYLDDWAAPRIYDITNRTTATSLGGLTPVYRYGEEQNSCTREHLFSVLQYVRDYYPAESYGVVLWSHASGWIPPSVSSDDNSNAYGAKTRSFGQDRDYVGGRPTASYKMSIDDVRDALLDFGTVDFLFFDACFMQNIETLYQLRSTAKYIIASSAEIPGPGAPYNIIMKSLFAEQGYSQGIVSGYYNGYIGDPNYGILLSAVETSTLSDFAAFTRPYVLQYKQELMNMSYDGVQDYFIYDGYTSSGYPDFYDMKGVMQRALPDAAYMEWLGGYERIFAASVSTSWWYSDIMNPSRRTVDAAQYSGVSMHIPLKKYADKNASFAAAYYNTDWAQDVWIESYADGGDMDDNADVEAED